MPDNYAVQWMVNNRIWSVKEKMEGGKRIEMIEKRMGLDSLSMSVELFDF